MWRPTQSDWEDWESDDFDPERVKLTGPSYSHEYFAAAFEAYMGVAKANGYGLDGYQALTREEMQTQDPQAIDWIGGLFHDYLQYTASIDSAGVKLYTEKNESRLGSYLPHGTKQTWFSRSLHLQVSMADKSEDRWRRRDECHR